MSSKGDGRIFLTAAQRAQREEGLRNLGLTLESSVSSVPLREGFFDFYLTPFVERPGTADTEEGLQRRARVYYQRLE